ncbi:ABC transporter G family member 9 [Aspergillus udagawae]|nr:ABC transporter G family member 9 [Aspergillus udagawae]
MTTTLDRSHGCVRPGEMLLVLGRPRSGCTTLLKLLANRRRGYATVEDDVHFGTMDRREAEKYQGQIVINTEEIFFPSLTVHYAVFDPPASQTCTEYLRPYLETGGSGQYAHLTNPQATSHCRVCEYRTGADYLRTLNLNDCYYAWRDTGITVIFILSSNSMVYLMMKLRTKASKKSE